MKSNKLIIGICISILLVLTIVDAKPSTNYETSATGRIVGNSPDDMIRQLRNDKIDFEHATYSEFTTISNTNIPDILKEQFNNNVNLVKDRDQWFDINDFQEFENNELVIHRTQTYWYTNPSDSSNIKDLENYLPNNYLLLYDTAFAGIFLPKQNLILNKFLSKGGPIIAPTYDRSDLFFDVFICNLGNYETLGETYKETRNAYYRNAGKNELLGLTLMSYNLYGNPLIKLGIPNTQSWNEYCDGITQEYNEQMISSNYNIQQYDIMGDDDYVKSVSHTINEYGTDNYENYSILKISGGYLNLDDFDVVLPKITKTDEFPQNTIITGLTNIKFEDPVELTIENLPSFEYDLVDRKCYENNTNPEVIFSHTYTEDDHEIVVSNIYPVEIVDCEQGKLKLYKKISYDIVYYPYSPIIITSIETDEKAAPNTLINVKINIQNTKDAPVDGTLYISKDNEILSKLDITTTKSLYELKLTTPEKEGVYNYKAEFYYENESRTYTTFKLDVRTLEAYIEIPDIIKESTGNANLKIENRFEQNINTNLNYYLIKDNNVIYQNTKSVTLTNGQNDIELDLQNLRREDGSYDLIVNIPYSSTSKTLTSKVYTNHLPVIIPETIELNEGENLKIEPQVFDSDGDNVNINTDSSFVLDGSYDLNYEDSGEYVVTVTANDDYSESIGEIKLKVNNVNRVPVLEDLDKITVYENELVKLNPRYSDPDNENSVDNDDNILTVSYSDKFNENGEWAPNFEESGNYKIYVSVSDGELSDSKEVEIEVLNKNRAPSLDNIEEIKIKEGEEINLSNLDAFDPDNDNNVTNDDNALVFSINSDKFINNIWETNYEDSGSYDINIEVNDGEFKDNGVVKILVENTNREPILETFEDITVNENELVKLNPRYSDPDNENSVTNDDNILNILYSDKFNQEGEWQTDYFSAGEYTINVRVTDGEYGVSQNVKITVNNVNRNPEIIKFEKDKDNINESEELKLSSEANDLDLEDLTYNWYLDDKLIETTNTNEFIYKPDYKSAGQHILKLIVKDPYGATDERTLDININNVEVPPSVQDIPDINVNEGSRIEINVVAEDYDNNPLTYTINDSRFKIVNNKFIWDAGYKDAGDYEFIIKVNNGKFEVEKLVKIHILDINRPSYISDFSPKETMYIDENENVNLNVNIEDPDDIMPEIIWYINGQEIIRNVKDYVFNANGNIGEFNIKVKIIDGQLITEKEFKIISMNKPKLDSYNGETTKFDNIILTNVPGFKLEKEGVGRIEFLDEVNLEKDVDFDKYSTISNNLVGIDTNKLTSTLNKKARITFYNIDMMNPRIYYIDSFTLNQNEINLICPLDLCYNVEYKDKTLTFDVAHFTSFYIEDAGGLWIKDVDIEINDKKENLDDNEKVIVNPKDEIKLLIKIENSLDIDVKDVELSYRLKDVKKLNDETEFDIKSKDTQQEEFEFDIPLDIKPGKYRLEIELHGRYEGYKYYSDMDAYLNVKEDKTIWVYEDKNKETTENTPESINIVTKIEFVEKDTEKQDFPFELFGILFLIVVILALIIVIIRPVREY